MPSGKPGEGARRDGNRLTAVSWGGGVAHPLWWGALLVLLINDHWLKGAGVAPAWLTGKLSDFAGMIVAPCLVATLARHELVRLGAFAAVALAFAAINLSTSAADVLVAVVGRLGLDWRIWSDPTDLVALTVLPLAWRLSHGSCSSRAVGHGGILLGAVACLATSLRYRPIATSVYLVNTTHEPIDVLILRVATPPDCPPTAVGLNAGDFAFDSCGRLQPFEAHPLDSDWRTLDTEQTPAPPAAKPRPCDIVLLRMPGLEDSILLWSDLPKQEIDRDVKAPYEATGAITVEQLGERRFLGSDGVVSIVPAEFELGQTVCGDAS